MDRRVRVGRVPEAPELALSVRDRAEEDAALADPLHAGNRDVAYQRGRRLDLHL